MCRKRAFLSSCLMLEFAYGVAVGAYRIFPYRISKFGVDSVRQVWEEKRTLLGIRPDDFLKPTRHDGDGVTRSGRTGLHRA